MVAGRAAELAGYDLEYLQRTSSCREKELVLARYLVMREVHRSEGSLAQAGGVFDKSHSTALHGIREVNNMERVQYPEWAWDRIDRFNTMRSIGHGTLNRIRAKFCSRWGRDRFNRMINELKQYLDEEKKINPEGGSGNEG